MTSDQNDRFEWIEHLVPLSFFRVLWDSLLPKRFERIVLDGIDGTPEPGYARPLAFCLGCWLLLYAVGQAFPWVFGTASLNIVFTVLPTSERHAVAAALHVDTIPGVVIPDSGSVNLHGPAMTRIVGQLHRLTGKHAGRVSGIEIAQYLEQHGNAELGLRLRGYLSRADDRPRPFNETFFVFFVVFGLTPGWAVSHLLLRARHRSFRQTQYVHMYNDSWLVVACFVPFFLATYSSEAFATRIPQNVLGGLAIVGLLVWMWRTVGLYRVTHGAPVWRVAASHVVGLIVALVMSVLFLLLYAITISLLAHLGF